MTEYTNAVINIDDCTSRAVDIILHTTLFNEEPIHREIKPGKKAYIVNRYKNEYISYPNRGDMGENEATLPYYSTNIRDAIQLCIKFQYEYELSYIKRSNTHLATINGVNFVHESAAGALSRALVTVALKKKFMDKVTIVYRLLDQIVEI